MNKIKKICYLGIGIALYFVLSMTVKIPLIGHIQTDLGYIVFGLYCALFGWTACIVGVIGCLFESLIISGWIPIGWMVGQLFIGISCGIILNKIKNMQINSYFLISLVTIIVSIFVGIGLVKTIIECNLYEIPFAIKFTKNCIACVADIIPMMLGVILSRNKCFKKFMQ